MGKSTISMAIFNSKLFVYQRLYRVHLKTTKSKHPAKTMVHDVQFSGGCLFYLGISLGCHGPWEVECSDVMEHITNTMNVVQHGSYMLNYAYLYIYI